MKILLLILGIATFIGMLVFMITGDGAFKKKFTISGIVTVHVSEKKTTCFVDSEAHGISCLPDWFIEGKMLQK